MGESMNLSILIPEDILVEAKLLQVYCYFFRMINSEPTKILKAGVVVELKRLEAAALESEIILDLGLSMDEINSQLDKLVEVDRISIERKGNLMKVRFKKLALPRSTDSSGTDTILDLSDYYLDDFKADYLQYVETNLSRKSLDNAKRVMKLFCEFIGMKKKIGELRGSDLENFKQWRQKSERRLSNATINIDVRTLKAAFRVAVSWNKINGNLFQAIKQIRCPTKHIRPMSWEEFIHLTQSIKEEWLLDIVRFAVLTGLRRGEIMNLSWVNVDLANGRITVQSSEEYQVKQGKTRVIPLNQEAMEIVRKQSK